MKWFAIASSVWALAHLLTFQETASNWQIYKVENLPKYQIRVKTDLELCDPNVNQISGYLDIYEEDAHFYFWMFESRSNPVDDPMVLWLNGGPGCSSMTGLLMELGPCSVDKETLETVVNPYSWNNNATVIFLDQPIGTGFSYGYI
jgi:cathepsin A (carboxypeptidase C)